MYYQSGIQFIILYARNVVATPIIARIIYQHNYAQGVIRKQYIVLEEI